jgi:peptidoglycan/xylan/chitin deacetylase (PgdA/CDA1 family)
VYTSNPPFSERGGAARGCLDLLCGRFPAFVFGGAVGPLLPVFHFHEVTRDELEPKLRHLAENGYRSVTSDEIASYARGDVRLPARSVALCFDDAWKSLSTVAAPLLKQFDLTAIAYAIPGRMAEDRHGDSPFVTWAELETLHASGIVDVQSHTYSHSMIFCSPQPVDFVRPGYDTIPFLNRPQLSPPPTLQFVAPSDLGTPLYAARSRMSGARRVVHSREGHVRCRDLVAREGGRAFFDRPAWRERLRTAAGVSTSLPFESTEDQERAIEDELAQSRSIMNDRLRTQSVNHICLPWGVAGPRVEALLKRTGYRSAFANRLPGQHAVHPGDNPFWLKRLPNRYISHLPGRGRKYWFAHSPRASASS